MNTSILKKFFLHTPREGFINITRIVQQAVITVIQENETGKNGNVLIFCPHTTAAITVNENADPDVQHDLIAGLNRAFPQLPEYRHAEENSPAHLKSSCVGCSETILVQNGELVLGTWQAVYFCEFDGPRDRTFFVQINLF
ncbi:MAG: secondary thiamine-phosphate synthase enzyme YjbQ [Treponema sp.]|jgi:secondary thiamine-phosphate synthase enzyme|nr:secondary thiamine-phosphate synthase enzyme YjbQ [Treponema sp.]